LGSPEEKSAQQLLSEIENAGMRGSCIFGHLTVGLEDGVYVGLSVGLEVGLAEGDLEGNTIGL